jgi:hypothetical protein
MNSTKTELLAAVRGPVMLITLGVLFLIDYFGPYPFYKTFPVLLIVFGFLKLLERLVAQSEAGATTPARERS